MSKDTTDHPFQVLTPDKPDPERPDPPTPEQRVATVINLWVGTLSDTARTSLAHNDLSALSRHMLALLEDRSTIAAERWACLEPPFVLDPDFLD